MLLNARESIFRSSNGHWNLQTLIIRQPDNMQRFKERYKVLRKILCPKKVQI